MELWLCRETSQTFGLLTLGFVWGWQCPRCPSGNPGVQWDFRPAVCCSQSSVAWRDTGDSGVAVIPISLGSFGSRDRGTNLQERGWSGCCSHRKEEGNSTRSCFSFSFAFDSLRGLRSATPQRRHWRLCCDIWGFLLWQFVPFLPFLPASHSLQLVPAPRPAVQRGGDEVLVFP